MEKQLEVLIRQAVAEGMTSTWWLSFIVLVLTLIAGSLSAYLIAYGKKKGEAVATKEDFEELLKQLQRMTQTTEEIKSTMATRLTVGESALTYRKTQLDEFYGPIYARLKLFTELHGIWIDQKLQAVNEEMIRTLRGHNEEISNIIVSKIHLIDGDNIPLVLTRFMTSSTIWNLYTARPGKAWVDDDVAALDQAKSSVEFEKYIYSTTERLKKELDSLHKKYGIT